MPSVAIAGLALGPVALFWGFSIDDAWIVTRIVEVAKSTGTFSLNPGEPATDAVTPLGYAQVLYVLSIALGVPPFAVARGLGVLSWSLAFFVAARSLSRIGVDVRRRLLLGLMALAAVTGGAWAGAGLETPLVALIMTLGFSLTERSSSWGAALLGVGAALRPDLIPVAWIAPQLESRGLPERLRLAAFSLAPVLLVMGIRTALFGDFLPLGFRAKPPDLSTGVRYAFGSLVLSGPFWLLVAARGRLGHRLWALSAVHLFSLALAGGDWMPLYRLSCPLLPWFSALGARAARGKVAVLAAAVLSLFGPLLLTYYYRSDSTAVVRTRLHLIEAARPPLEGARRVASIDIGWLSHASAGSVVDLSGVANPRVAHLPGGHTSHRIPVAFLDHERVDTWVVRVWDSPLPDPDAHALPPPSRAVYGADGDLLRGARELGFAKVGELRIARTGSSYALLRRAPEALAAF